MTPERIDIVVKKLLQIADTKFSDYAGFHLDGVEDAKFNHAL